MSPHRALFCIRAVMRVAFTSAILAAVLLIASNLAAQEPSAGPSGDAPPPAGQPVQAAPPKIEPVPWMSLLMRGGIVMIPIGILSIVAVFVAAERLFALREDQIIPGALVQELGSLGKSVDEFDPKAAYRICQQHPSCAATVLRSLLLKLGRPVSEVEAAVQQTSQREAERLYSPIRWLLLTAAVSPLLGLLGTVQGMIQSFFVTANMPGGTNKVTALAEGIYVALVTTLGGLCVAIPAVILAHFFEGRIQRLFRRVEELTASFTPHAERFEGKLRVHRDGMADGATKKQAATTS